MGETESIFINILSWSILPQLIPKIILSILYLFRRGGAPATTSPTYQRHYKNTYALVVGGYLLFTAFIAIYEMKPNYYKTMGISLHEHSNLKSTFRKLSKELHPDKSSDPDASSIFIQIRHIYEVLKEPTKRDAYDRLGVEDGKDCSGCVLYQDYLYHSLLQTVGFYVGIVVVIGITLLFGNGGRSGVYWRVWLLMMMMCYELGVKFKTVDHSPVSLLLPWLTLYEQCVVMHKLFININSAVLHIGPSLGVQSVTLDRVLPELEGFLVQMNQSFIKAHEGAVQPFQKPQEIKDLLINRTAKTIVEMKLYDQDGEYRQLRQGLKVE